MNTLDLDNNEYHYTDSAEYNHMVFLCSYYVSNHSPSWFIIAESIEDAKEYMIDNFECVEDPDLAYDESERELLESYFSIVERVPFDEFIEEFESISEVDKNITDYMIEHGSDCPDPSDYIDLIGQLENVGDYDTINHYCLSREFLIIDEDNIKSHFQDRIEELVKDCYLNGQELPSFIEIDWEQTAKNCSYDGYGNEFSSYDGSEELIHGYYIFCTN